MIETGDWVKVDADNGIVEITKKAKSCREYSSVEASAPPRAELSSVIDRCGR